MRGVAREQNNLRRLSQESHNLVFRKAEEVVAWYKQKTGQRCEEFMVQKIHEYLTDVQDQDDLQEALRWLSEHLFGDDHRVTLKYKLPGGGELTAMNYDFKDKGWRW